MKAGIIAAGTGQRLKEKGITTPKPLIKIAGKPLIRRAIEAAIYVGANYIACIVNDIEKEVAQYLKEHNWPVTLKLVVKTTANSMESLFNLAPFLDEPFLLLTVDAIYPFDILKAFVNEAKLIKGDGALAITKYIDDEKPLWVKLAKDYKITDIGNDLKTASYITAGFYYFEPYIFKLMNEAKKMNLGALRQFLSLLVKRGYKLYGIPVPKVIDLDHPEDIEKAEAFVKGRIL